MQHFIVLLILLIACFFVGRSFFHFYRSGKCSCSEECSGCEGTADLSGSTCFSADEQKEKQEEDHLPRRGSRPGV
ncbi:MAG: FeoB-associated Cys-rich membrane protein [Candidatus Electrothrix sp. EH2]|nr:FeoB-associated Cys-rich membrane protein [Candidatus Electrothrix sp. EH2]